MYKDTHGDVVANTLQCYRERTKSNDLETPTPYQDIKKMLQKTMEDGKRVLLDIKDSYNTQTVVVRFERVYDRWAMGKATCYFEGEEVLVPYTIHYSDILCKLINMKVIIEGDNPFGGK